MQTKQLYDAPRALSIDIDLGRPIMEGSQMGMGADVTIETEKSFDDAFNE